MVTQAKFTYKGLSEWMELLAEAADDVDGAVHEVIFEAATEVEQDMKSLVPIDTGNLHDHIQIDGPHQEGNFIYADVGVIHDAGFTDKDTAIYGNVMEYGSTRVAAQPYIRPAIQKNKSILRRSMQKVLKRYGV